MGLITATSLAALLLLQDPGSGQHDHADGQDHSHEQSQDQDHDHTAPASPCDAEEYRAFDFWVGEWDVTVNGFDQMVASSRIEKRGGGCAIQENWMPVQGGGGTSITSRDPDSGTWHQLWVGSVPGRVEFEGGIVGGNMVLTGYWGADSNGVPQLVRMTYTPREDGSVRQHGEVSTDHGGSWAASFDFIYTPKAE